MSCPPLLTLDLGPPLPLLFTLSMSAHLWSRSQGKIDNHVIFLSSNCSSGLRVHQGIGLFFFVAVYIPSLFQFDFFFLPSTRSKC
jgi:hypothetical protein